jgi:hypothetical protein
VKEFTELAGVSLRTSVIYGSIGKGRRFDPRDAQPFRLAKFLDILHSYGARFDERG